MSGTVKIFKDSDTVGRHGLPADFPYLDGVFISSLIDLDFKERASAVYTAVTSRKPDENAFSFLEGVDEPASVVTFDDGLAAVELSDGKTASFYDYVFDKTDLFGMVASVISIVVSVVCDLISGGAIDPSEKVIFACPFNDGLIPLSLLIAKKTGVPIEMICAGDLKPDDSLFGGLYLSQVVEAEIDEVISDFYDEYSYPVDPLSALSLIALDNYLADYDDNSFAVFFALVSPYLYSRRILKDVTGKNEISTDKAERALYLETALDIPDCIKNKKMPPFFNEKPLISAETALTLIKCADKI